MSAEAVYEPDSQVVTVTGHVDDAEAGEAAFACARNHGQMLGGVGTFDRERRYPPPRCRRRWPDRLDATCLSRNQDRTPAGPPCRCRPGVTAVARPVAGSGGVLPGVPGR